MSATGSDRPGDAEATEVRPPAEAAPAPAPPEPLPHTPEPAAARTAEGVPPFPEQPPHGAAEGPAEAPDPDDRPEIAVGAAFAGGLALAIVLKILGR